ncbi:MAG: hypothetical protein AAGF87_10710 [Bacteroidota bacterium]
MKNLCFLLLLIAFSCARDRNDFIDNDATEGVSLTSPDTEKTMFVWDFSTPKSYLYDVQMEMNMKMVSEGVGPMTDMEFNQVFELIYNIAAKENGRADIYMQDFEVIEAPFAGMEDMIEASLPQEPTLLISDMDAGGQYDPNAFFSMSGLEMMGAMSPLPLPTRDLKVGETDTLTVENSMQQPGINVEGKQRIFITFAGYDEYEGKNCAVLVLQFAVDDTSFSIDNQEGGSEEIEMDIDMETGSRFYWDPVGHYFLGAELLMDGSVGTQGAGGLPQMPENMDIEMDMVQRIKLREIE